MIIRHQFFDLLRKKFTNYF